jgi:hypothetical protein
MLDADPSADICPSTMKSQTIETNKIAMIPSKIKNEEVRLVRKSNFSATKLLLTCGVGMLTLLTGCTQRVTDFTIISTKNVDISALANAKRAGNRITGEDLVHVIIFIPTGVPNLKDGVVYFRSWMIPLLYGQSAYIVEGTPLLMGSRASTGRASAATQKGDRFIVSRYDSATKSYQSKNVTKQEFAEMAQQIGYRQGQQTAVN